MPQLTQVTSDVISTNTISGLISQGFTSVNVATVGTQTIQFGSGNTLVFQANTASERMRIDSNGNMLLGTTTRQGISATWGTLYVGNTTTASTRNAIVFGETQTASESNSPLICQRSSDGAAQDLALVTHSGSGAIRFFTGASSGSIPFTSLNAERMRITPTGQIAVSNTGSATAPVISKLDDLNTGIFFPAADTIAFSEGGVESMRIDSSGNLLVGRTTGYRAGKLVVSSTNVTQASTLANLQVTTSDTQAADVGGSIGLGGQVGGGDEVPFVYLSGRKTNSTSGNYAGYFAIAISGADASTTERMRIDSNGNVGIGTVSPSVYNAQLVNYKGTGVGTYLGHSNSGTFPKVSAIGLGSDAVVFTHTSGGSSYSLYGSAQIAAIQSASVNATTDMAFYTTSAGSVTERMRILSGGEVAFNAPSFTTSANMLSIVAGRILQNKSDDWGMEMSGANTQRIRFYSSAGGQTTTVGSVTVNTTTAQFNAGNVQLNSNGVTFPATQNASSDANTLDDYEEGTWTPVITNGTTGVTSYYWQTGLYRKIGNLVWIEVQISVNVVGISSGNIKITGLPFPVAQKSGLSTQSKTIVYGVKYAGSPSGAISMIIESSNPSEMIPFLTSDISSQLSHTSLTSGGQWHFQGSYVTTS